MRALVPKVRADAVQKRQRRQVDETIVSGGAGASSNRRTEAQGRRPDSTSPQEASPLMTLWGGRFSERPDDVLWRFSVDHSDRRLLVDDVTGSLAHVRMLGEVGLLTLEEVASIVGGLALILGEVSDGTFAFEDCDEDVHSGVERRLGDLIGSVAGKLHTGRSRNDQVATDLRLYLKRAATDRIDQLKVFVWMLIEVAESVGETVVPAYTHLQQGQSVPLAHHLLAYAWMTIRDIERFEGARSRIDVSPLGAGALGGSSLPIDPDRSAELLAMAARFNNSMDAVAARDHVAEFAFAATQAMVHVSRLAEECILWATTEFAWVTFADSLTAGSSAMPQKKNPDIAELARGKTATAIGHLNALLTMQKGLPLAYNRDLQEDKTAVFAIDDTLAATLEAMTALVGTADFHPLAADSSVTALDLAEVLVERGVPFREAHGIVGRLVSTLAADGRNLGEATVEDLNHADQRFVATDVELMDPVESVRRRRSAGGGSFESVAAQLKALRSLL